jgi:outer membrane protein
MKKAIVIMLMLCGTIGAQAQTKVAHINRSALIETMPEADSIQKKLLKEQEQWQLILSEKEKDAQIKYTALMKILDDPNVPKTLKEIQTQEVENLQKQYQELNQRAQQELQKKQEELLGPLLAKVKETISKVAKANGYAYVMDTTEGSGIIYSDDTYDLMPLVKAELGIK